MGVQLMAPIAINLIGAISRKCYSFLGIIPHAERVASSKAINFCMVFWIHVPKYVVRLLLLLFATPVLLYCQNKTDYPHCCFLLGRAYFTIVEQLLNNYPSLSADSNGRPEHV